MRHPDDERLSRLAASSTSPERPPADHDVEAHVEGCPRCQHRLRDLRAVRHTLNALSSPAVPADLANQITAHLHDAETSIPAVTSKPALVLAGLRERLLLIGPRHLAIAAAVAVAAGGISIAVTGGGSAASSTLPSLRASEQAGAVTEELAPTPTATPAPTGRDTGNRVQVVDANVGSGVTLTISGNDYGHTTLGDGVNALFRTPISPPNPISPEPSVEPIGQATSSDEDGFVSAAMPTGICLRAIGRIIDHSPATLWTLRGVELARYNGRPATILAFVSDEPQPAHVVVAVDGTCTANDPLVLDQASVGP